MHKSSFNKLSKSDIEYLRKKYFVGKKINIIISKKELNEAILHLKKLYGGKIYIPFAERLIILNKIN